MRKLLALITAAVVGISLTACEETYRVVPATHIVRVTDADGNIDQHNINQACLSTGVKSQIVKKEGDYRVAYVICNGG